MWSAFGQFFFSPLNFKTSVAVLALNMARLFLLLEFGISDKLENSISCGSHFLVLSNPLAFMILSPWNTVLILFYQSLTHSYKYWFKHNLHDFSQNQRGNCKDKHLFLRVLFVWICNPTLSDLHVIYKSLSTNLYLSVNHWIRILYIYKCLTNPFWLTLLPENCWMCFYFNIHSLNLNIDISLMEGL